MNRGGLTPFGFGLFHHNHEIKAATVDFFDSLQQYPVRLACAPSSLPPLRTSG